MADRYLPAPESASMLPAAGSRRGMAMDAQLKFFYGPMDCGKSTLALQTDYNHARQGRRGLLLTRYDRSGRPEVSTRIGLSHAAIEITDGTDLRLVVREHWAAGRRVDYLIVDEAGFLTGRHVDQLAELVDDWHVDVYCFGLAIDFRARLLPGAQRLFELADELVAAPVEVLCWCGRRGRFNARVQDGQVVRDGPTVVVGDTGSTEDDIEEPRVRYQVLCRMHYRRGELAADGVAGQLRLDGPHKP